MVQGTYVEDGVRVREEYGRGVPQSSRVLVQQRYSNATATLQQGDTVGYSRVQWGTIGYRMVVTR